MKVSQSRWEGFASDCLTSLIVDFPSGLALSLGNNGAVRNGTPMDVKAHAKSGLALSASMTRLSF